MTKFDFDALDFDSILEANLPETPPPSDVIQDVTPWKTALNRILVGLGLSTITLNFGLINYFMTEIGLILIFLGFRTLRTDNNWFRSCYQISTFRLALNTILLIINATMYQERFYDSLIADILSGISLILTFVLFLFLRKGFHTVQETAGMEKSAKGAVAALVWYTLLCVWAVFLPVGGWLIAIPMILGYIFILRSLWKLARTLDEAGYAVRTSPLRFSDRTVVLTICVILALGISCGLAFTQRYPMAWATASPSDDPEVLAAKEELLAKGFPEQALDDLSAKDLLSCKDAKRVLSVSRTYPFNEGHDVIIEEGNDRFYTTEYDVKELRLTSIGVELPGEKERWKIIHHFHWDYDPGYFGTESIQLWPTDRMKEAWHITSDFTGHVLYDSGEQTYIAPYYSMGYETYESSSIFFGNQTSTDFFAHFSFPNEGEHQRGYVAYTVDEINDGWILDSWINYTHQLSPLQYPVISARTARLTDSIHMRTPFETVQDALQFYPMYPDDLPN